MNKYPEYLEKIPINWNIKKIKHFTNINPPRNMALKPIDSKLNVLFLPMEKVSVKGEIIADLYKPLSELWNGYTYFESNDVLIAKITPCFENGKGALIPTLKEKIGFGSTEFHVLRAIAGISNAKYLFYMTKIHFFRKIGAAFMSGAAGQKRIPVEYIQELKISLPPIEEQEKIAVYLDYKTNLIDTLIEQKEKQIQLLKEYRTTLISQVVTGKIDIS